MTLTSSLALSPRCTLSTRASAVRPHVGIGEVVALRADSGLPEFSRGSAYRYSAAALCPIPFAGQAPPRRAAISPSLDSRVLGRVRVILRAGLLRGVQATYSVGFLRVACLAKRSHVLRVHAELDSACVMQLVPCGDRSNKCFIDKPMRRACSSPAVACACQSSGPHPAAARLGFDLVPEAKWKAGIHV